MAQDLHPALDVGGAVVDGGVLDAADATQVRGAHFGDEFFLRVRGRTEDAQVGQRRAVQPRLMPRTVGQLVQQRRIIRFRALKALQHWHVQRIGGGSIERLLMAMEDRGLVWHIADQLCTPLDGAEAVRCHRDLWHRHPVKLRRVKHGVVAQHKACIVVPGVGVLSVVDLPEHDGDPALAFPDGAPGRFDLVERRPERGRIAHCRQQPDVDAPVRPLAEEVAWHPRRAVPRLLPGHHALLQQRQDAIRDDLVRWCERCGIHERDLHGGGRLKDRVVGELAAPTRLRVVHSLGWSPRRRPGPGGPTAGAGSAAWRPADRG